MHINTCKFFLTPPLPVMIDGGTSTEGESCSRSGVPLVQSLVCRAMFGEWGEVTERESHALGLVFHWFSRVLTEACSVGGVSSPRESHDLAL